MSGQTEQSERDSQPPALSPGFGDTRWGCWEQTHSFVGCSVHGQSALQIRDLPPLLPWSLHPLLCSPVDVSAVKRSFLTPGNGLTPSEARIQRTERLKLNSTEPFTATSAPLCRLFIIQSKGAAAEGSTNCYWEVSSWQAPILGFAVSRAKSQQTFLQTQPHLPPGFGKSYHILTVSSAIYFSVIQIVAKDCFTQCERQNGKLSLAVVELFWEARDW